MNNKEVVDKFIINAKSLFGFLEKEYGYVLVDGGLESEQFFPDSRVFIKYRNSSLEIEVFWYFASAIIGVVFIKSGNDTNSKRKNSDTIINLYALASFVSGGKEDMFILKDTFDSTFSKIKKRERLIRENMVEIIENLVLAVNKYALDIIAGDTSCFLEVQKYQLDLIKRQSL